MGRNKKDYATAAFYQKMPIAEKELIDQYAAAYNMDKQDVAALVRRWGWKEFRKRYPLPKKSEKKDKDKEKEEDKEESEFDKHRKQRLRDIYFDHEHSEKYGWRET
jgi:hypothetical protein